jgi:RNA polymerase sigma-70 factor, ECF subfamily
MADMAQIPGDEELVRRARAGETAAFEKLVERHFRIVYAIAYGRLRNRETAEDLAQEVFLRIYLFMNRIERPAEFAGWVIRVTRNLAIDWARRGQRASRLIPMVPMDETHEEIADERADNPRERLPREEQDRAVREAIFRLPEMQRDIVMLHYTEGMNQRDIAERLAVHPATVGRQLKSALSTMQGHLEPILRESAPSLRAPQRAMARALTLIAAAALIPHTAKASVVAAASDAAWTSALTASASAGAGSAVSVLGLFQTIKAALAVGGKAMITGKGIAVVVAVLAGAGGTTYYMHSQNNASGPESGEDSPPAMVAMAAPGAAGWAPAAAAPGAPAAGGFAVGVPMVAAVTATPGAATNADPNSPEAIAACRDNLQRIQGAKQQWALEFKKPNGTQVTWQNLLDPDNSGRVGQGYLRTSKVCPSGGEYSLNPVGQAPTCSLGDKHDVK